MAGYDLDKYKDLEGVKGTPRVMERPHVVLTPIHRDPPKGEEKKPEKGNVKFEFAVISAAPVPEEKPKVGKAHVERQMVVMGRVEPRAKKPATMSDVKI